jgi:hypothetical protein
MQSSPHPSLYVTTASTIIWSHSPHSKLSSTCSQASTRSRFSHANIGLHNSGCHNTSDCALGVLALIATSYTVARLSAVLTPELPRLVPSETLIQTRSPASSGSRAECLTVVVTLSTFSNDRYTMDQLRRAESDNTCILVIVKLCLYKATANSSSGTPFPVTCGEA